jgi:hypothetical protein
MAYSEPLDFNSELDGNTLKTMTKACTVDILNFEDSFEQGEAELAGSLLKLKSLSTETSRRRQRKAITATVRQDLQRASTDRLRKLNLIIRDYKRMGDLLESWTAGKLLGLVLAVLIQVQDFFLDYYRASHILTSYRASHIRSDYHPSQSYIYFMVAAVAFIVSIYASFLRLQTPEFSEIIHPIFLQISDK